LSKSQAVLRQRSLRNATGVKGRVSGMLPISARLAFALGRDAFTSPVGLPSAIAARPPMTGAPHLFCWRRSRDPHHITAMDDRLTAELADWVTQAGLKGRAETTLLSGFCERAVAAGIPLAKASLIVDTLHPIHEGRVFRWQLGEHESTLQEYGRTTEGEATESWHRSPFYYLWRSGEPFLQRRLTPDLAIDFPILADMRAAGLTD
jgi:hypothetical protein